MGSGSSGLGGAGGGNAGGGAVQKVAPARRATVQDNRDFRKAVDDAVKNSVSGGRANINKANSAIKQAMDDTPVGTEFQVFKPRGTQEVYEKQADGSWLMTHMSGSGQVYWTKTAVASDIFNDWADWLGLLG